MEDDCNILEWIGVDPKDEALAKQISKKLLFGETYFTYNVPLQIWIGYKKERDPKSGIDLDKSQILNYMPRKDECRMENLSDIFSSSVNVTAKDIKDFMKISSLILKNLARLMDNFDPLKLDRNCVYYPNSNEQK